MGIYLNKIDYDELPTILIDFLHYTETIKVRSPLTVFEYSLDLKTFFRFLLLSKKLVPKDIEFDEIPIKSVDLELIKSVKLADLYSYLSFTQSERGNNARARARKVSSLRSFYKYITSRVDLTFPNPTKDLDSPKVKKSLPRYLTVDEASNLLDSVEGDNSERNYAIITLFLNTGIRLSELVGVNVNSINRTDNSLIVLGKGNKERLIYLNKAAIRAIDEYLKVRPDIKGENALFVSRNNKRISPKTVQWIVKKFLSSAGLDTTKYSVHKLRHTAATLMYQNGTDLRVLQEILGHTDLGTTEIYTHIKNENLKSAFDENPLSSKKPLHKNNNKPRTENNETE